MIIFVIKSYFGSILKGDEPTTLLQMIIIPVLFQIYLLRYFSSGTLGMNKLIHSWKIYTKSNALKTLFVSCKPALISFYFWKRNQKNKNFTYIIYPPTLFFPTVTGKELRHKLTKRKIYYNILQWLVYTFQKYNILSDSIRSWNM